MKFILTSTSGDKYDIPTTIETIKTKVMFLSGYIKEIEKIVDVCEVNSIEELMDMVDKVRKQNDDGEIIVGRSRLNEEYGEMEIYDAYRE
jgi:hypothetical protein